MSTSNLNCQAGIIEHPPEHVLVAGLNFSQRDATNSRVALGQLRSVVRRELAADLDEIDPETTSGVPTPDTGELGVATEYDTTGLSITLGLGTPAFEALGIPNPPADLIPINWGWFNDSPANPVQSDLVVQVCADSAYVVEHVLRRIEHTLASSLTVTWTMAGEQRGGGDHGGVLTQGSGRALIGFHDGLSNLDPNNPTDLQLIFCGQPGAQPCPPTPPPGVQPPPGPGQPGYNPGTSQPSFPTGLRSAPSSEPTWTAGGSYLLVRGSVFNMAAWDQMSLLGQQQAVGRWKYSGASLDNQNQIASRLEPPQFATSPTNVTVPPTSHVRRANPRAQSSDTLRRIFRRGYPMLVPQPTGTLQRGLLFIAFGRSLSTQVEFIMRAWLKNPNFPSINAGNDPLLQLESQVLAGGYYFVPPVVDQGQPWNWALPIAF
jgi:deferrochelatase/peroxidase EfeB